MTILLVALASILLSVSAQFSLKAGMSSASVRTAMAGPMDAQTVMTVLLNPFVVGGLALYALSAVVWLSVLAKMDVSKAYPMVGLGFALTAVIGFFAGEQLSPVRIAGVALICTGVALVARS